MKQTIIPNATFRDGQRGELGAPDANGFASFVSITGARFTVHVLECMRDSQNGSVPVGYIFGCDCWTIRVDRVAAGPIMAVFRTPTAAQCNAKRNARMAAKLADVDKRAGA